MILLAGGLKAFVSIVQTGTVHAAAKQLGLSQTAITQRLKSLEEELKLTLFLRSRRGMTLTSDGSALEGLFLSRIGGKSRADVELTLVGPTSAVSTRVVPECAALYKKFPHLRLHLLVDDHSNRIDLVRKGEADLVIVPPESVPNEMDSKVLKPDRYILVGSAEWKGRKFLDILASERVIDFYENDPTTTLYLKKFHLYTEVRTERLFVNENFALIQLFKAGVGYGTLTESVAKPYLNSGELIALNKGQTLEDPLALAWYPRTQKPDYFAELIKQIR